MPAGKKIHRTRLSLADLISAPEAQAPKKISAPDNKPTPQEVAALARKAITRGECDAASDILTACETAWTKVELADFWRLMK